MSAHDQAGPGLEGLMRSFRESDLAELLDTWQRAAVEAHSFLPDSHFVEERRMIAEEFLPASDTTVFELEGAVVGFVSMVGNEVGGLFVDPRHQGKGIGRALLDRALLTRANLELGVFEQNTIGRRFYDRYGFSITERRIEEGTGEPELRMRFIRP